jgi:hypothetical protein
MLEVVPAVQAKEEEERATRQHILEKFERMGVEIPADSKWRD